MAITILNNQPIRFQNSESSGDCSCEGQRYCQLINNTDDTQFQIATSNTVTNGNFDSNLNGWTYALKVSVTVAITNESAAEECDGEIEVSGSGGTGPYTYSIEGGVFGALTTFSNLCAGTYVITVKDSLGNEGSASVTVFTNVTCGDYEGATIQDLIDSGITLGQLYNCTLGDLQ